MDVQLSTSWILDNSVYLTWSEDEQNLLYCISCRIEVEKLHLLLSVDLGQSLVGLHGILSPHARNLKVLDFTVSLYDKFLFRYRFQGFATNWKR